MLFSHFVRFFSLPLSLLILSGCSPVQVGSKVAAPQDRYTLCQTLKQNIIMNENANAPQHPLHQPNQPANNPAVAADLYKQYQQNQCDSLPPNTHGILLHGKPVPTRLLVEPPDNTD